MNNDVDNQWIADQLDRIELQLSQARSELSVMKGMLIFLAIVSPIGVYCIVALIGGLHALGVLWIAIPIVAGLLLLLLVARLTGMHKALRLKKDDLARILKEHDRRDDSTRG
jgi:type III secretory pathway component EscU